MLNKSTVFFKRSQVETLHVASTDLSRVMGDTSPASAAYEGVTFLFFYYLGVTSKLFSDLNFLGPDDLGSDLRGH